MRNADSWTCLRTVAAFITCLIAAPSAQDFSGQSSASRLFDEARLISDIQTYYDFGIHRTSYPGDRRTSEWLAERFRTLGLQTSTQTWPLRQFFLEEASIEDSQGRIEAFPLWLPRATDRNGLRARLILVEASTPLTTLTGSIAWLQPDQNNPAMRSTLERRALEGGAVGIVFSTNDTAGTGLLVAQNAERRFVQVERPVPTLTFGAAAVNRLRASVGHEVTLRLIGRMEEATASNVLGRLISRPDADWIVVSTPSSGWFTCGGERGPGIAMLLALAEWATARHRDVNYLFVANSGHELDFLGARLLHEAHLAPPAERTRAWLHLGASIATPPWRSVDGVLQPLERVTNGTLQATALLAPLMRRAFVDLPMYSVRSDTQIGEFRDLAEHGYRGIGVVGGGDPWFHTTRDDPTAVSAKTLVAVSRAAIDALGEIER
jgi:hypothetical protein